MSLRLICIVIACSMALAHNIDRLDNQKLAGSLIDTEIRPMQMKSVHRRQSPEIVAVDASPDACALSADKISEISHDAGSLGQNKRSVNVQPEHNAEPGCCG